MGETPYKSVGLKQLKEKHGMTESKSKTSASKKIEEPKIALGVHYKPQLLQCLSTIKAKLNSVTIANSHNAPSSDPRRQSVDVSLAAVRNELETLEVLINKLPS